MAPPLAPFDASDADLTLRTPDGMIFQVYSHILAIASPVFHDMFKIPQPDADKNTPIPVVNVSESSEVMDALLRFIYPVKDPSMKTLSTLSNVLDATDKYNMVSTIQTLGWLLVHPPIFVNKDPVLVYAITCQHGLKEVAKVAATCALTTDVLSTPLNSKLKLTMAYNYHQLISLHQTRSQAALELLDEFKWSSWCLQCVQALDTHSQNEKKWHLDPSILEDWFIRAKEELQLRPTTDVIFSLAFFWMGGQNCTWCHVPLENPLSTMSKFKERIDELHSTI